MKLILLLLLFTMVAASAASYQNEGGPVARKHLAGAPRDTAPAAPRIAESGLVTLSGNTRPEAIPANDLGRVAEGFRMEHMMLLLRRTPEQERALEQLIDELHNPKSPNFHHWLTAKEFGERYGLAQRDLGKITGWLQSHGFEVNVVYPNRLLIDFSGTAAQVHEAFHTEIHHLEVNGEKHFANMSDPQIPAALAPAVAGVASLHDFRPKPMIRRAAPNFTFGACQDPKGNFVGCYRVAPPDLATIYNLTPLFAAGYSGQGQTIVVVEDSDLFSTSDWTTFRSTFGLSGYTSGSLTTVHPPTPPTSGNPNCTDPGVTTDDNEANADVEWSSAAAPSAAIVLASCASVTTSGVFLAAQNLINSTTPPAIISVSFGSAESQIGAAGNLLVNTAWQQAVAEGISIFVSSGDFGAAISDGGSNVATHGINVNGLASTPYNIAVGGTDFGDTYAGTNSTYWASSSSNSPTYGSALSYIPEIPWNESCASALIANYVTGSPLTYGSTGFCNSSAGQAKFLSIAGGSGGPSGCATGTPAVSGVVGGSCAGYAKPSWQSVFGNPADGVRDLPDVALFAASGVWNQAYVLCFSDTGNGGAACTGNPENWTNAGGTSIAAPIMAAIQSLINQATGSRAGNPNPAYYALAALEYGNSGNANCNSTLGNGVASSCIFYDVTQGDMDVPCQTSVTTSDCYIPSGTYGVLSSSTSSYAPAYAAGPGWDFATGIGTPNAYNLVMAASTPVYLSPFSVAFPAQPINVASAATPVSLSNLTGASLTFTSLTISGGNTTDFGLVNNCPSALAYGASCQFTVKFTPTAPGPRKSSVSIKDNSGSGTQTVILTGVGAAASLSPTSLSFTSQTVGTSSTAQTITLTNVGSATIHIWQIAITGTNAGDFSKTTTCGATLAASTSCTVSVTFKPTATGPRSAAVLFSNDGGGSPQAVGMTGTGM